LAWEQSIIACSRKPAALSAAQHASTASLPKRAQHVERVEGFAFAVLDQAHGEGFAFADDPDGDRIIGSDVTVCEQQVECCVAALTGADAVPALFAARAANFMDDKILQQALRPDVVCQTGNA
jgi:hypothetical protein